MGFLYIAGERPGAGATAIAVALATLWRRAGNRVAIVKPVASSEHDCDSAFFAREFGGPVEQPIVIDPDREMIQGMAESLSPLNEENDVVIVEGQPLRLADGYGSPALAECLNAVVLGVIPYHRTVDESSATDWRKTYGTSLSGVIVNRRTFYGNHDATTRLTPSFNEVGVPIHGILTEQRMLLAPTIQQVADLLGGTFYAGASGSHELVEHFLIGGLITEWGGNYFGRLPNQAVFVRGGRTDIQMAALNTPLRGLFLTGCQTPPQYVYQRATDLDVPLVVVKHDTASTAVLLETIDDVITVDHPTKIDLLAGMVLEAVDLTAVASTIGLHND